MKLLYRFINYFGVAHGLKLFINFRLGKTKKIKLPEIDHTFGLRPNTTDIPIFYQVFFNQPYEHEYGGKINSIIDAGANIGLASIFYANKFPNAQIIALEPQNDNYLLLKKNTVEYKNIIPVNKALWGEKSGISISDQGYGESGYIIEASANGDQNATTIDEIMSLNKLSKIDILKIDIEGSEKEVFESNYESWLPNVKCLIIELHDNMRPGSSKAVLSAMSKYNFRLELKGENLFFFNLDIN